MCLDGIVERRGCFSLYTQPQEDILLDKGEVHILRKSLKCLILRLRVCVLPPVIDLVTPIKHYSSKMRCYLFQVAGSRCPLCGLWIEPMHWLWLYKNKLMEMEIRGVYKTVYF
jgi:hypothetical protein